MEKENELSVVNLEQAKKLKALGFDWKASNAFLKKSNEVEYTFITRVESVNFNVLDHYYDDIDSAGSADIVSAPTIALALKWIRKRYGIFHSITTRSWSEEQPFVFSIWHNILPLDITSCDLSAGADEKNDGAIFDFDKAEMKALEYALNYLYENINRDFSFIKPGGKAYIARYRKVNDKNFEELNVLEVNDHYKTVKVKSESTDWSDWVYYRVLYSTPKEVEDLIKEELNGV